MKITYQDDGLMIIKNTRYAGYVLGLGLILFVLYKTNWGAGISLQNIAIFIFAIVIGVVIILATPRNIITIDKSTNDFKIDKKAVIGPKSKNFKFDEIEKLKYEKNIMHSNNQEMRSIKLILKNGDSENILKDQRKYKKGFNIEMKNKLLEIGTKMAEFLNLPFEKF